MPTFAEKYECVRENLDRFTPKPPQTISKKVRAFCAELDPTQQPVILFKQPAEWARPHDCFPNVREKQQRDGGGIQHGWMITQSPWYLEAQFHAVWVSHSGEFIDVTPDSEDQGNRVVFLPDSRRIWKGDPILNRFHYLSKDPLVRRYLDATRKFRTTPPQDQLHEIRRITELRYEMLQRN